MLRESSYNIYVPTSNNKDEYIFIHGYSGALDIVSSDVYRNMKNSDFSKFSKGEIEALRSRGFLTEKTAEEELEIFKTVAGAMLKKNKGKRIDVTIVPTYDCNFRCPYCFERDVQKNDKNWIKKKMTHEFVDEMFASFENLKTDGFTVAEQITLFGGEPLLLSNMDIISYIVNKSSENGYYLSAITNGYEADHYLDYIGKEPGKIQMLQITLDGKDDFHNKRRFLHGGGETFDKIVQNVDLCLEKGASISLRTNVDMSNLDHLDWLVELYETKGWTKNPNFSYHFKSVHACYVKEGRRIFDDTVMKKLAENQEKTYLMGLIPTYTAIKEYFHTVFKDSAYAISKATFCGASTGLVTIDPYGDIYPCWEVIGDTKNSIGKMENSKIIFNDNAKYWRNRNVLSMETCSKCAYALMCGGNCPAHAKGYTGDIYASCCEKFKEIFHEVLPGVYNEWMQSKQSDDVGA
jgi:uncharacterized protein